MTYSRHISAKLVPTVVEQTHRGERGWDIFSRLLKDRSVFVGTEVDDSTVGNVRMSNLTFEINGTSKSFTIQ